MSPDRPPIRLAVVNDYEIVVRGLAAMLEPFGDRVRLMEQVSGMPVLSEVDVVLFDSFAQQQGRHLDVSALIAKGGQGDALTVVFSWNAQGALVEDSLRAGAAGYLSKGLSAEQLVQALEQIHAGQVVVPAARRIGEPRGRGDWPGKAQGLSVREAEVVALITRGLSNQEIADQCYLSINSVKTYVRTAYRKIGAKRRAQAVLWGVEHGFQPNEERRLEAPEPSSEPSPES